MRMENITWFKRDRKGVAAIEFALWSVLITVPLLTGLDFGLYTVRKLRMNSAVEQAAIVAFQTRQTINQTVITDVVTRAWGGGGTVDVRCNGSTTCVNTSRPCGCISGFANRMPTFTSTTCTATCANGTKPGYYLTVRATANYAPTIRGIAPPATLDRTTTVRLQ